MSNVFGHRGLERGQGQQRSNSQLLLLEGSPEERGRQGRGSKGGNKSMGQMVHRGRLMDWHRMQVDENMGVAQ